jgi:DinB superfamily
VEELLRRLEDAHQSLIGVLKSADAEQFAGQGGGESIKTITERTSDDVNFYYGRLTARARSLPHPPCIQRADFSSLREAVASVQVAHRRFTNLLHDLTPGDLARQAADPELGSYTMRQILEMATAHYALRTQQVSQLKPGTAPAGG